MRYLFRSQALQYTLSFLALHTEHEFDVDQLAASAGVTSVATREALKYLERDGLVSHRTVGRRWLYRINVAHPYFPELRSIAVKSLGGRDEVRKAIAADRDVLYAAIFGSFARGGERGGSDLDVLFIVADRNAEDADFRLATAMAGVSARIGRDVSPTIYSASEFLRLRAAREESLKQILAGPVLVLKGELPK
jgi:predicted nucleotidyltransferase